MKRLLNIASILYICFILMMPFNLMAQRNEAVITGKANSELSYLLLGRSENFGIILKIDTIRLSANKSFNYHIKLKAPELALLKYGSKTIQLYLIPNETLEIDLENGSPKFTGKAAMFTQYFIDDKAIWFKIDNEYQKRNPDFGTENNKFTDRYFTILDSISKDRISFMKQYFTRPDNNNEREFIRQQLLSFRYSDMYYKGQFQNSDIEKFKFYQAKYHIKRDDSYAFTDKADFKDVSLIAIGSYRQFANMIIGNIALKRIKDSGEKFDFNTYVDLSMLIINELSGSSPANIELKAMFLNNIIEEVERDKRSEWVDKLNLSISSLRDSQNTSLKLLQQKLIKIAWDNKFKKGNQAPDFTFTDTAGTKYSLKDFQGKKIYIDMGSSWCGPCIASIPAWNKLVAENQQNKGVVFISLSLDENETKWHGFLKEHNVNGVRLYAGDGGFKSSFAKNYAITSIPHFILIDERGKLIQYTAPMPDSEEIRKLLMLK